MSNQVTLQPTNSHRKCSKWIIRKEPAFKFVVTPKLRTACSGCMGLLLVNTVAVKVGFVIANVLLSGRNIASLLWEVLKEMLEKVIIQSLSLYIAKKIANESQKKSGFLFPLIREALKELVKIRIRIRNTHLFPERYRT